MNFKFSLDSHSLLRPEGFSSYLVYALETGLNLPLEASLPAPPLVGFIAIGHNCNASIKRSHVMHSTLRSMLVSRQAKISDEMAFVMLTICRYLSIIMNQRSTTSSRYSRASGVHWKRPTTDSFKVRRHKEQCHWTIYMYASLLLHDTSLVILVHASWLSCGRSAQVSGSLIDRWSSCSVVCQS